VKKTFKAVIILIIFLLLLCGSWAEGQTFSDKPFARLGKGTINTIAYSPDGKLLAMAGSVGIWLYSANNLTKVGLLQGHTEEVLSVAFSPNGKMLASAGGWDKTVRLWDVVKKKEIAVLEGHTGKVLSVAFSPDGKTLASSGADGAILLWGELPPASVETEKEKVLTWGEAKHTVLLQNYPNPFNPETWIPFVLHEGADVEIRIYDTTGHPVRMLQLGRKEAGIYRSKAKAAYWDGKNGAGESVSSGVYFYELRTWSETFVRKAMLLK